MAKAVFPPTEEAAPHLVTVPQANTGTATDVSCHHMASHQVLLQQDLAQRHLPAVAITLIGIMAAVLAEVPAVIAEEAAPHLIPDQVLVPILLVHILPAGIRQAAPALNKPAAAANGLTGEHALADLLAILILRLLPAAPPLLAAPLLLVAAPPEAADHPAVLVRQAIIGCLITEAGAHLTVQALRQAHLQRLLQPPLRLRRPPARLPHQQQNLPLRLLPRLRRLNPRLSLLRLLLLRLRPNLNPSLLHPKQDIRTRLSRITTKLSRS